MVIRDDAPNGWDPARHMADMRPLLVSTANRFQVLPAYETGTAKPSAWQEVVTPRSLPPLEVPNKTWQHFELRAHTQTDPAPKTTT